jgi:hypothetical protein
VATGVVGNVATSVPEAAIKREIVRADGAEKVAEQFDPWDARARTVDLLLGAVFGAKAHVDARAATADPALRDALMTLNAARHLEEASAPGRAGTEAQLTQAVESTRQAIEQIARGEPVAVPRVAIDPAPAPHATDMEVLLREGEPAGEPIDTPPMRAPETVEATGSEPTPRETGPRFPDDVRLPDGTFDPATGEPRLVSANEMIGRMQADAERVRTTAPNFMQAAANCLLGAI